MNLASRRTALRAGLAALVMTAVSAAARAADDPAPVYRDDAWLTADQRGRADRLVSFFENDTIVIQYGYTEALGNGRGFTVGRGFTTGTGDALAVVERYDALAPRLPACAELAPYIAALRAHLNDGSDGLEGLAGFPEAWNRADRDPDCGPAFRLAQDEINDEENYLPAMKEADARGLRFALSRVALYDAAVVHGMGSDPDGLPALARRSDALCKAKPACGESDWLRIFLQVRRQDLLNPANAATRAEWSEGTRGRTESFAKMLDAGNTAFAGPLQLDSGNFVGVVP